MTGNKLRQYLLLAVKWYFLVTLSCLGYIGGLDPQPTTDYINQEFELTDTQRWKVYLYENTDSYREYRLLSAIIWYESNWRHYELDGETPLRGRLSPSDVGLFQIKETVHLDTAQELGYDIYTPEGNIDYALWLYKTQGTQPWKASKHKWSNAVLSTRLAFTVDHK